MRRRLDDHPVSRIGSSTCSPRCGPCCRVRRRCWGFNSSACSAQDSTRFPDSSKYVHFASLASVALSTILLLTPAAHHRIVEAGQATEAFHRFASRILLSAMVPLVLGVAGDVFVVVRKVTVGVSGAVLAALAVAALCYGLWFGLTLIGRHRRRSRSVLRRVL